MMVLFGEYYYEMRHPDATGCRVFRGVPYTARYRRHTSLCVLGAVLLLRSMNETPDYLLVQARDARGY